MKYSSKFYLLDEDTMNKLNAKDILEKIDLNPTLALNEFNTAKTKENIIEKNMETKTWDEFGSKIKPILSSAQKKVDDDISFDPSIIMQDLEANILKNKLGLAFKMYSFLSGIDGIKISNNNIFLDGKSLNIPTSYIIRDLIYTNNELAYDYENLIPYIANYKEGDDIILNKQVKRMIKNIRSENSIQPPHTEQTTSSIPTLPTNQSASSSHPQRKSSRQKGKGVISHKTEKKKNSLKKYNWWTLF